MLFMGEMPLAGNNPNNLLRTIVCRKSELGVKREKGVGVKTNPLLPFYSQLNNSKSIAIQVIPCWFSRYVFMLYTLVCLESSPDSDCKQ